MILNKYFYIIKLNVIILYISANMQILHAATPVVILPEIHEYPLGLHMDILEDATGKYSIQDILTTEISNKFFQSKNERPRFGVTNHVYWVRFTIINQLNSENEFYLEQEYTLMDKVTLYIPPVNSQVKPKAIAYDDKYVEKKGGDLNPFENRDIKYRNSVFRIHINPSSQSTYYMRFESTSSMELSVTLWKPYFFTEKSNKKEMILGLFYGILAILVVFNFMIFLTLKDVSYFYYVLVILAAAFYQLNWHGHTFQYLCSNLWWSEISLVISGYLVGISGIQFTRSFLNTKKSFPMYDLLLIILLIFNILALLMTFVIDYSTSLMLQIISGNIIVIIFLVGSVISLIKGNRAARFYLLAFFVPISAIIIFTLRIFTILPDIFITTWSQEIGLVIQVTLLSLALADRINIIRKEKIQAQETLISSQKIAMENQIKMTDSFARFVPKEFLDLLNKESIVEVALGDQVQKQLTVLFSDIRSFTTLSEKMSAQDNFNFLNAYLKRIGPIIRSNGGFIDKYIGDAIMALFSASPDNAIDAAVQMQLELIEYNKFIKTKGNPEISVGIGLHYGNLILGTIGENNRMEGTVISDDVNLASRIESLTKYYKSEILISDRLFNQLGNKDKYNFRIIDTVMVKGKNDAVTLIEILDENITNHFDLKIRTKEKLNNAFKLYQNKSIEDALKIFNEISAEMHGDDQVVEIYIDRCNKLLQNGIPVDWHGIERFDTK